MTLILGIAVQDVGFQYLSGPHWLRWKENCDPTYMAVWHDSTLLVFFSYGVDYLVTLLLLSDCN
jgi:hypothetical protein